MIDPDQQLAGRFVLRVEHDGRERGRTVRAGRGGCSFVHLEVQHRDRPTIDLHDLHLSAQFIAPGRLGTSKDIT